MADELKVRERWFSERMQHEVAVMRWGVFGQPVLVFPSAGGDAGEIERHGLVDFNAVAVLCGTRTSAARPSA